MSNETNEGGEIVAARNETVMRKNKKEERGKNEQKLSRHIFTPDISNKKKPSISPSPEKTEKIFVEKFQFFLFFQLLST